MKNIKVSEFDVNRQFLGKEEKTSIHSLNRQQLLQEFQDK